MADSFDILAEKFRMASGSFFPSTGILDFDNFGAILVDHFTKSANLTDYDAAMQCLCGTEKVLYSKIKKQGRDISWVTLDESIESIKWFQFKDPRRFMKAWEHKMSAIFDIIDQDRDGFVNQEEFNIYYQLGNRKDDTQFLTRSFRIIDTEMLGKLTKKQYVEAYVNYFSDPDISYEQLPMY